MGCDIHNIVEVKENGVWKKNVKKIFTNTYYMPDEKNKPKENQWEWALEEFQSEPSTSRNYDWFAILADVRNGRGFAGVSTVNGFNVIAMPRGVPNDSSDDWKKIVEEWGFDMHSHSYLYIDDFDNFDWNQVSMKYGVISLNKYKELRGTNKSPDSWSGSISGEGIIVVEEEIADLILNGENPEISKIISEIKTRMPRDQPGSLPHDSYVNIVAYILQTNKFPAGDTPLVADAALARTFITRSATATARAAEPITTGQLVQVVGCLDGAAGNWTLTKATEPTRTETPDASSAEELKELASVSGDASFKLLGIYAPVDEHKGHRMETKGFIVRDPEGDRLNVVSLELVAEACQ